MKHVYAEIHINKAYINVVDINSARYIPELFSDKQEPNTTRRLDTPENGETSAAERNQKLIKHQNHFDHNYCKKDFNSRAIVKKRKSAEADDFSSKRSKIIFEGLSTTTNNRELLPRVNDPDTVTDSTVSEQNATSNSTSKPPLEPLFEFWPFLKSYCNKKDINISNVNNLLYFMSIKIDQENNFYKFGRTSLNQVRHFINNKDDNQSFFLQSFQNLKDKSWLDNGLIDFFLLLKKNTDKAWKNVNFMPTFLTTAILGDNESSNQMDSDTWFGWNIEYTFTGKFFVPYSKNKHWCFLELDFDNHTICNYDPLYSYYAEATAEKNFLKYIEQLKIRNPTVRNNLKDIAWRIIKPERDRLLQEDGYNCGIFVLKYIELIVHQKLKSARFNPDACRIEIAEFILLNSSSMYNYCLICSRKALENPRYRCDKCRRGAHDRCAKKCFQNERLCNFCADSNYSLDWKECHHKLPQISPRGLPNVAGRNNCWLISSLQALFALPLLDAVGDSDDIIVKMMKEIRLNLIQNSYQQHSNGQDQLR